MITAYLSLGSNLGDRAAIIRSAIRALNEHPSVRVIQEASLYETAPQYLTEQPTFLNTVIEVRTELDPHALLSLCLQIERIHSRERTLKNGPRTLDIDILIYGKLTLADSVLQIPHPKMHERAFVRVPLSEIAPHLHFPDAPNTWEALSGTVIRIEAEPVLQA